ncbi:MAG: hypothetical protein JSS87_12215 [Acidobacteria bacterium]|nr:hypothetical protein [Acidobacteriota bacterium]
MQFSTSITLSAILASAAFAASAQSATPLNAQTGVSNPPEAMTIEPPAPKIVIPKVDPSPARAVAMPSQSATSTPATVNYSQTTSRDTHNEDDSIVPVATTFPAPALKQRVPAMQEEDAMIVTSVPSGMNELPTGTMLRVRFHQDLSTTTTVPGTTLLGELVENVERNGRVLVPAGSALTATVTSVRGGKRIHGAAMFHIEPRSFTLPDGTILPVHAMLIDTDNFDKTRVDNEGNLIRRDHAKETFAALSLSTGGAAAAGGVIGGVPGALIGGAVGAGVSTVWWLKQDRQLHVSSGSTMVFQLTSPTSLAETKISGAE